MSKTNTIRLRVTTAQKDRFQLLASNDKRSLSNWILMILENQIDETPTPQPVTLQPTFNRPQAPEPSAPPPQNPSDPLTNKDLIALREAGTTITALKERTGQSQATIYRRLKAIK